MAFERELLDKLQAASSPAYLALRCIRYKADLFLEIFRLCNQADTYKEEYPIHAVSFTVVTCVKIAKQDMPITVTSTRISLALLSGGGG